MDDFFQCLFEVLEVQEESQLFFVFTIVQREFGVSCGWVNKKSLKKIQVYPQLLSFSIPLLRICIGPSLRGYIEPTAGLFLQWNKCCLHIWPV